MLFQARNRFRQKLGELQPDLYRLAWSWCHDTELAQELAQETCAKALQYRSQLQDINKIKPWLFRILANLHTDYYRSRRERVELENEHMVDDNDPADLLGRVDSVQRVRDAMQKLDNEQRKIITLIDLTEFTYIEVSEILNIPIGTVMSRINRARSRLKTLLLQAQSHQVRPVLRSVK